MSRKCLRVQELGRGAATMALFVAVACAPGCGTLGLMANRESIDRQIANDPKYSIAGVQGPTERGLRALQWNRDKQNLAASGDGHALLEPRSLLEWGEHPEPLPHRGLLRAVAFVQPAFLVGAGAGLLFGLPPPVFLVAVLLHLAVFSLVRKPVTLRLQRPQQ